jgi:hypothetical protein
LVAACKELVCFFGEVVGYTAWCCGIGLIDVDALDRAAELLGDGDSYGSAFCGLGVGNWFGDLATGIFGATADGVIEDEDFRCAGAVVY